MNVQPDNHSAGTVTYRFTNIGPVKDATLELGRLTVIAGRNNTGKTYVSYSLYGFLKTWRSTANSRSRAGTLDLFPGIRADS